MGAVLVYFDTGLRLRLGVRIASEVRPPFNNQDPLAQLCRHPFGDRQPEEPGADDEEVETRCHRQLGYLTLAL
jgi:hypothetical protein